MPAIDLATNYSQRYGPTVQVINLIVEKTQVNQIDQKSWISRPGLDAKYATTGSLRGIVDCPIGFLAAYTGFFYVSGSGFYFQAFAAGAPSFIGAVAGADFVSMATTPAAMLICGGDTAYRYDGAFAAVVMPGAEPIAWVAYMAGYFLLGVKNSQHIFYMTPGSAAPGALDFFSAEVGGDNTVRGIPLGDQLVIFCEAHTEFWQASGDVNLPFNRIVGQLYSKGLASRFAVAELDNSLYFVGSDLCIYRAGAQPVNVGDPSISARLRGIDPSNFVCWSFVTDSHAYFILTVDFGSRGTLVLDVSTGLWAQWTSFFGIATSRPFAAPIGLQFKTGIVLGGGISIHSIYDVSSQYTDDDGTNIDAFIVGGVPIIGPAKRCDNVTVIMDAGIQSAPVTVSMNYSDDQGNTVSAFQAVIVQPGDFTGNPIWWQLGLMQQPLRLFFWEFQNAGPIRIWTARYNESFEP